MNLVEQRGRYDCGVACLAMVLNMSYEQADAMVVLKPGTLMYPPSREQEVCGKVANVDLEPYDTVEERVNAILLEYPELDQIPRAGMTPEQVVALLFRMRHFPVTIDTVEGRQRWYTLQVQGDPAGFDCTAEGVVAEAKSRGLFTANELMGRIMNQQLRAIVSVPSLNISNGYHFIVVNGAGDQVLDPSPGAKYHTTDGLPVLSAILIPDASPL